MFVKLDNYSNTRGAGQSRDFRVGEPVKVNAVTASPKQSWTHRVPYVILTLYKTDIVDENVDVDAKHKLTLEKFNEFLRADPACVDPYSLKQPRRPVVDVGTIKPSSTPAQPAVAAAAAVVQKAPAVPQLPDIADVSSASLKCMLTDTSGVLSDDSNKDHLCFFELSDLNITNIDGVSEYSPT